MASLKCLIVTPQEAIVDLGDDHSVLLVLDVSHPELGLAPGLGLALRATPAEARRIAELLVKKANEAEAGLPRA